MHPKDAKLALRDAIKQRLSRLTPKEREAESRSICRRLLQLLPPAPAVITVFYPLQDEVDLRPLITELIAKGYQVYLPSFERTIMRFRRIADLDHLAPDGFKIPAALPSAPELDPRTLTIALIPGRAFNRRGQRLGRGNGGFDIWIRAQRERHPATQFWGICFEHQIVDDIPMEAHDECVDAVIIGRGNVCTAPSA